MNGSSHRFRGRPERASPVVLISDLNSLTFIEASLVDEDNQRAKLTRGRSRRCEELELSAGPEFQHTTLWSRLLKNVKKSRRHKLPWCHFSTSIEHRQMPPIWSHDTGITSCSWRFKREKENDQVSSRRDLIIMEVKDIEDARKGTLGPRLMRDCFCHHRRQSPT